MSGKLLVSVSSIFDETRKDVAKLLAKVDVPVALLVSPHIDGHWHLAKDTATRGWLAELDNALILNGFDKPAKGRRAEFASLDKHEARLRLKGATRQMAALGFNSEIFAPPRWRLSEGTLAVLDEFGFRLAASTTGLYRLGDGEFVRSRALSVGEGFGAAPWWRSGVIRAAQRGAAKGNTVRLSVSARNLSERATRSDFVSAVTAALDAGAQPGDYRDYL
ncbi:DUF2334 domain-containing protein [Corynebacterium uterequi]|uniref:Putative deacetylase n=1 Tax=Corynebacterium uterequi TaxID=1072256 RepID=A0A0G3HET6_9CORY|nr:DUF2334 domain-containing protein [Corynebacterium uterequi]AKK11819.1 putative deacetylase [Corynebacterium uterequi]